MLHILSHCHDFLWSFLHGFILNIPPTRLPLFPALAGSVWFLTLASLLLTWLARGMPRYPGQSNPHTAQFYIDVVVPSFISDIASFELKPLFLIGSAATAVGFVITVAAVHVVRYEPGFALERCPNASRNPCRGLGSEPEEQGQEQDDPIPGPDNDTMTYHPYHFGDEEVEEEEDEDHSTTRTLKLISLLSIFAAGLASTALILLSVMDTFRYKIAHHIFLRLCFAGLAIQSACTAIVYSNEVLGFVSYVYHLGTWKHDWGNRSSPLRPGSMLYLAIWKMACAALSTFLIIIEVFLGMTFLSLTIPEENPQANFDGCVPRVLDRTAQSVRNSPDILSEQEPLLGSSTRKYTTTSSTP
ncbi:hypothetical protein FE257_009747 [Aspergillus nanangensis]|uniref:CWH43-like N-terminal domain-containing protein n=1 Tax=Aspergillus nanangensis TaxID=2582783 RepID=A0AAD4GRQ1_ASPNN|nr:hypothetical protein FE257_009747 [Aspergillus nanangensis]